MKRRNVLPYIRLTFLLCNLTFLSHELCKLKTEYLLLLHKSQNNLRPNPRFGFYS